MDKLMSSLGIDETFTKPLKYNYPKVKNETFPVHGYNCMADILMLPETKKKFKYLLTIVDIWSNYCDFEPMKNKDANSTLKALKAILKRKFIKEIKASLRTDNGSEFKGEFNEYLKKHNILHLYSLPDRHKQLGNIENLNKFIGRILMTYLTNKTNELNYAYCEWTDIIDLARNVINDFKKHPKDEDPRTYPMKDINVDNPPLFKVGDLVYHKIEIPKNEYGEAFAHTSFRMGDRRYSKDAKKIVKILLYTSKNPYRYILNGMPNVSYAEAELKKSNNSAETWILKKIIDKKIVKGKVYYLCWWRKYLKKDSTWESRKNLLEDDCKNYINEYEKSIKDKNIKK